VISDKKTRLAKECSVFESENQIIIIEYGNFTAKQIYDDDLRQQYLNK
jgi:hypothetical protein